MALQLGPIISRVLQDEADETNETEETVDVSDETFNSKKGIEKPEAEKQDDDSYFGKGEAAQIEGNSDEGEVSRP